MQPYRTGSAAALAQCLEAAGQRSAALEAYADLAGTLSDQGASLVLRGKADAAQARYTLAAELLGMLVDREGLVQYAADLAAVHAERANGFMAAGRPDAVVADLERAIGIEVSLSGREVTRESAFKLARNHKALGDALVGQKRVDEALGHYREALRFLEGHADTGRKGESLNVLALSYNNRGVVLRVQNRLNAAMEDFNKAMAILALALDSPDSSPQRTRSVREQPLRRIEISVQVALGHSGDAIEVLTRTRWAGQDFQPDLAAALAICASNRGYAQLAQGEVVQALQDFERSAETFEQLMAREGTTRLAPHLAKSLAPLAWVYATHPDVAFRNGARATELAQRACELTEWNSSSAVATLAAAYAEAGALAEAVRHQESAIELAPAQRRAEMRRILEVYRSGRPYRVNPTGRAGPA
jgi:tetratricopeptide (TPR) repeat protein